MGLDGRILRDDIKTALSVRFQSGDQEMGVDKRSDIIQQKSWAEASARCTFYPMFLKPFFFFFF